jgi:hypothetical protein
MLFNDVSAQAPSPGLIASSTGSFDSVTVTSETDQSPNRFSFQINTNLFTTPMCGSAPAGAAGCSGWQQFVFKNDDTAKTALIYMEYWLIGFGNPCPQGWNTYENSCWKDSVGKTYTPQNIQSLVNLIISGTAETNGTDTLTVTTPGDSVVAVNEDSFLTLAPWWTTSEFNVFGIQGGSEAFFAPNTTLIARNSVEISGANPVPVPESRSFTGESNNLTIAGPACTIGSPFFAITYEESNVPGTSRTCVTPPPANFCQDAKEAQAFDEKALAAEQLALKTPTCQGSASNICVQAVKAIEARLSADAALAKKDCQ